MTSSNRAHKSKKRRLSPPKTDGDEQTISNKNISRLASSSPEQSRDTSASSSSSSPLSSSSSEESSSSSSSAATERSENIVNASSEDDGSSVNQSEIEQDDAATPLPKVNGHGQEKFEANMQKNDKRSETFESFYLRRVTAELAEDLDKVRQANDFSDRSLGMLVRALKQGAAGFGADEVARIEGVLSRNSGVSAS